MPQDEFLQNEMNVDGTGFDLNSFSISFNKEVSVAGTVISGIHGGIAVVSMDLEFETQDNTVFADWFLIPGQRKDVKFKLAHPSSQNTFLEITMEQAAIIRYGMFRDPVEEQTSELKLEIMSQKIRILDSPIELKP